jgi:hypothetical protein
MFGTALELVEMNNIFGPYAEALEFFERYKDTSGQGYFLEAYSLATMKLCSNAAKARLNALQFESASIIQAPDFHNPSQGFGYISQIFGTSASETLNRAAAMSPNAYIFHRDGDSNGGRGSTGSGDGNASKADKKAGEKKAKAAAAAAEAAAAAAASASNSASASQQQASGKNNTQRNGADGAKIDPRCAALAQVTAPRGSGDVSAPFVTRDYAQLKDSAHSASLLRWNAPKAIQARTAAWRTAGTDVLRANRDCFYGITGILLDSWQAHVASGGPSSCRLVFDAGKGYNQPGKVQCVLGRLFPAATCSVKSCLDHSDHTQPAKLVDDPTRRKIFERTVAAAKALGAQGFP